MIKRFEQVSDNLFRGSVPEPDDISILKNKYNIDLIISLDKEQGKAISKYCKENNIKQLIIPLKFQDKASLIYLLSLPLHKIFSLKSNIFVHCLHGKDRTGLFIMLYRIIKDNWSVKKAILEALSIGFASHCTPQTLNFYYKALKDRFSKDKSDAYDAVSNVPDFDMNQTLNRLEYPSWSPFADYRVKDYPYEDSSKLDFDQPTRQNFKLFFTNREPEEYSTIPQVGIYDQNTQGINGAGPSMVGSGFV